jgi:hypothetical protein
MIWATGRPAATSAIAASRSRSRADVDTDLAWLAERGRNRLDADGNVIGIAGLSVTPTRHHLINGDRTQHPGVPSMPSVRIVNRKLKEDPVPAPPGQATLTVPASSAPRRAQTQPRLCRSTWAFQSLSPGT